MYGKAYWYKDPDKFHYDSPIVQETWKRDYHKHKVISNKGYKVFYIWYQSNRRFRFNNKIFNKHQIVDAIVQEINHEIN